MSVLHWVGMDAVSELRRKLRSIWPHLDERTRRLTAANEALSLGHGGVSLVHRACGLSRKAIAKGIREISLGFAPLEGRVRQPGAGRKPITASDPELVNCHFFGSKPSSSDEKGFSRFFCS